MVTAARLQTTMWRSVHGKTWGLQTAKEYEPGKSISPGHVGLILGHWTLWNHLFHILPRDDSYALILEDDVEIPADFMARYYDRGGILDTIDRFNPQWQFVFLGLAEREPEVWHKVTGRVGGPDSPLCKLHYPFGTHAYIVRRSALATMIDAMCLAERNIDQQLYEKVLQPDLINWAAYLPILIRQRTYAHGNDQLTPEWAPSTIDPAHTPSPAITSTESELKRIHSPELRIQDPQALQQTLALTNPFPCIYRGEIVDTIGRSVSNRNRSVPLSECARLNILCHSKPSTVGAVDICNGPGYRGEAKACELCALRLGMEVPGEKRERLPVPEGHFNPSLVKLNGGMILATRDNWGHSKVALWKVRHHEQLATHGKRVSWDDRYRVTPIASVASILKIAPRLEDPRLFVMDIDGIPRLHCMFSLPDGYPAKKVRVGYCRFTQDLQAMEDMQVFDSPHGNLYEKNWVPFVAPGAGEDDDRLFWIYASKPSHLVYRQDDNGGLMLHSYTANPLPWTGGVIRGGAAPIHIPGRREFWHFFHGALKRPEGTVYTVGCLAFEDKPPFRILRQTPTPLMWPDLPAEGESVVKRYVVWPGGVVMDWREDYGCKFRLALGIDDTFCRIHTLAMDVVEDAMKCVPETVEISGRLQDSEIAKGFTGK